MARSRVIASVSVCALLLVLSLVCGPGLAEAQDDGSAVPAPPIEPAPATDTTIVTPPTETPAGPWSCTPLAFVLAGRWIPFTSRSADNSFIVMLQQPIVTAHNIVMVFGMDQRARVANDTSTLLHTFEFKSGSEVANRATDPRRGRYMSQANLADQAMMDALPDTYAPMRFDITVPWKIDTRRFLFAFRHIQCGEQRILYKYNPRGPVQPIIPSDVPIGVQDPTAPIDPAQHAPVVPPTTTGSNVQHCQLTAFAPAGGWACTPAFARDVYDYQCTAPSGAFLERVTVQAANTFLAMRLTAEADASLDSVTRGLLSGVDSSTFPLAVGRNVIEIGTEWGGVCNASYVFEVKREEAPVVTPGEPAPVAAGNWRVGEWGVCAGGCSDVNAGLDGSQTREVVCVTEANESVEESRCTAAKPAASQACELTCAGEPEPNNPTPGTPTDGANGGEGGLFSNVASDAHASSAASPLALLAAVAFAFLALNQ